MITITNKARSEIQVSKQDVARHLASTSMRALWKNRTRGLNYAERGSCLHISRFVVATQSIARLTHGALHVATCMPRAPPPAEPKHQASRRGRRGRGRGSRCWIDADGADDDDIQDEERYEDLLESYEVAKAEAAPGTSKAQQELTNLHESQVQAYEAYAKMELIKMAESQEYPSIEEGESMPAYLERVVTTVKAGNPSLRGWRASFEFMEEAFWSKIKAGARKAYFALKSRSVEKDKQGEPADQTTGKVKTFEAAAFGALVSKSESQDSEMADGDDERDEEGGENEEDDDAGDDDEAEDDDDEEENDDEDGDESGGEDGESDEEELDEEVDAATLSENIGKNTEPSAKTPMKTKKRRRLPHGPLGGGGSTSTITDIGKRGQPTKKQKTGKGANGENTGGGGGRGGAGGRGKGGAKSGKAGRGGGGGRGTRKRNRKKGAGAGAGGVA